MDENIIKPTLKNLENEREKLKTELSIRIAKEKYDIETFKLLLKLFEIDIKITNLKWFLEESH